MGQKYCCFFCQGRSGSTEYVPLKPTCEVEFVVASQSYKAYNSKELTFNKGDKLEVIKKGDNWWLARHPGKKRIGFVPVSYVAPNFSLESYDWFHGPMSRLEAEQILMNPLNSPGAFLVRKSYRIKCYVLSMKITGGVFTPTYRHYKIGQTKDGRFLIAGLAFVQLSDLVKYFVRMLHRELSQVKSKRPCVRPKMQDKSKKMNDQWETLGKQLSWSFGVKKL